MLAARLLGREVVERRVGRQFDVHRQPVGIAAGLGEQLLARAGNGLEMDVAAKAMVVAQRLRDPHEIGHRVVLAPRDARRQEQALDAVAPVEVERQLDHLVDREPGARDIARAAADAIGAVVDAEIGQQDLQQRHAAAVRRVGVADAGAGDRADAAVRANCASRRRTTRRRRRTWRRRRGFRASGGACAAWPTGILFVLCSEHRARLSGRQGGVTARGRARGNDAAAAFGMSHFGNQNKYI